MWGIIFRRSVTHLLRCTFLFGIIFIVLNGTIGEVSISHVPDAYAMTTTTSNSQITPLICPSSAAPTNQSLLVVLLDRSGSLTDPNGPTDPKLYSTSVTKALADLWPGRMEVIPFSGVQTPLPMSGTYNLSDMSQRNMLKGKVQNYVIGGGTPLAPAMDQGLKELQKWNQPGSRVILITDGAPTGVANTETDPNTQQKHIRNDLLHIFCQEGIPVSAFGLNINDSNANQLLTDIARNTGADYSNVRNPKELAQVVIKLYADWQHLNFLPTTQTNDSFTFKITSFSQATIIAFRSEDTHPIKLDGPDGQPLQDGVDSTTDRHYEIDKLTGKVFVPGNYTVQVNGDSDAQVYALVKSRYYLRIVAPTVTKLPFGNTIQIDVSWYDDNGLVTPGPNQAAVVATVTFMVNGHQSGSSDKIILSQQGAVFQGQIPTDNRSGQLNIVVDGTFQGIPSTDTKSIHIVSPPLTCHKSTLRCILDAYSTQIIFGIPIFLLLLLLLVLLVWWLRQPSPSGWLSEERFAVEISNKTRRLKRKLLSKSVVSSHELQFHPHSKGGGFKFNTAIFDLVFKRGGGVYMRPSINDRSRISVNRQTPNPNEKAKLLANGNSIEIDRNEVAKYWISRPRGFDSQGRRI